MGDGVKRLGLFLFCALMGTHAVIAAPTPEQVRQATADYFTSGNQDEGIDKMSGYISRRVSKVSRVPSREMVTLSVAGECVELLEWSKESELDEGTVLWLLESNERLHLFVDVVSPEHDDLIRCVEILNELRTSDPEGVDHYFDLALAIAVVMDKPVRKMHFQMGKDLLPYSKDPEARFRYFKALFDSGDAKIDYDTLSVRELVFVVHVPVPHSELEWARKNEDGKLSRWGEKYSRISYDHQRLDNAQFKWQNGTYTLDAIRNSGGICVDQAYFSVITARAFGIPSIYFRGQGESCNHAWFAFMEKPGEWHLGVGRYGSEYTTGFAVNPQTNRQMTDHDVEYTCERSLQSDDAERAESNMILAQVLLERDPDSALKCAKEARTLVKRFLPAWQMEQQILITQQDYDGLLDQFDEQKDMFRKYPYILAESARIMLPALKQVGRAEEAAVITKRLSGVLGEDQEDLVYTLELEQIDQFVTDGNMKKARRELEQMMENPSYGGNKSFGLIRKYVDLTRKSGQTKEAVKFLEDYVEELLKAYRFPPTYEIRLWSMMEQAYQNNGNQKDADAISDKIGELRRKSAL